MSLLKTRDSERTLVGDGTPIGIPIAMELVHRDPSPRDLGYLSRWILFAALVGSALLAVLR